MATIAKAATVKGTSATPSVKAKASTNRPDSAVDKYFDKAQVATATEPKKRFKKKLVTKEPETKKVTKVTKGAADHKNIKDTVTTIVKSKREVKYIYPTDIEDDAMAKKSFRQKARDKDKSWLKDIEVAKKKKEDTAKLEKQYHAWRKTTYLVP